MKRDRSRKCRYQSDEITLWVNFTRIEMNTKRVNIVDRNILKFQQRRKSPDRGQKRFALVTRSRTLECNYNYAETNASALYESNRWDSLNRANKPAKRRTSICHACEVFDRQWVNKQKILAQKPWKLARKKSKYTNPQRELCEASRDKQNRRERLIKAEIFLACSVKRKICVE